MKPTQVYGDETLRHRPPALGAIRPLAAGEPQHVLYRARVRRVRGVVGTTHEAHGHRYYILAYKRGHAPENAHLAVIGPRGQRRFNGVIVRSDHCTALKAGLS